MIIFWALYGLLLLGLLAELISPSPPPEEKAEIPALSGISALPQEEGREVRPELVNQLVSRLARLEDRFNIENRLEVRDAFLKERRP